MTPYWSDSLVTLYLGDCREVTEWLTADVLVTDPPYGRDWRQGTIRTRGRESAGREGIAGDTSAATRDSALMLWGDRLAVVFGDLMLAPPAGNKLTLIYRKPPDAGARGAMAGYRRDAEAIYLLGPWSSGLGGRSGGQRLPAVPHRRPCELCSGRLVSASVDQRQRLDDCL